MLSCNLRLSSTDNIMPYRRLYTSICTQIKSKKRSKSEICGESTSHFDIGYTILAQDQVSVAPLCGRFTIRAYHVSQMSTLPLVDSEEASQDVSYTLPSACEDWVVTQKFKHATNESVVWLHNVVTQNSEQLIESSGNRNYILPKVYILLS